MPGTFRQGAIGALLYEYERAISELKQVIADIPDAVLTTVADPSGTDENCRSIQTVLTHVVSAGYGYAASIHNLKGHAASRPDKVLHLKVGEYIQDLTNLFAFTEYVFSEIKDHELEEFDNSLKIQTNWGQSYDIEQLTEHAIVHILRHRRQIERFILINERKA